MLLIPCPHCGERDESEFTAGGDANRPMPPLDGTGDIERWHGYLHLRGNPRGRHVEFWHHTFGCERWLKVERDTVDHRVFGAVDAAAAEDKG